jgi:diguanylate cyclase (GGDEF)-like protein
MTGPDDPGPGPRAGPRIVSALVDAWAALAQRFRAGQTRDRAPPALPQGRELHDHLTGVMSREGFTARLGELLSAGQAGPGPAVLLFNVDRFRAVNDLLGFQAGDELLVLLAHRLTKALPSGMSVARVGGDEFAVLVPEAGDDPEPLAAALVEVLRQPAPLGPGEVQPAISAGITVAQQGDDVQALLRGADVALAAGRAVGSRCQRYEPALHAALLARQQLEMDLGTAAGKGELVVHYQPVVDLRDGHLVGAEGLVRWRRPGGELMMPGEFIALAEDSGAILSIGMSVLEQACRQTLLWNRQYRADDPLDIAVNLSVRQLQSTGLAGEIAEVVDRIGIDPGLVNLEVTESSLMDDTEEMIRRLEQLKAIGLSLSMDDFGTGYSSLSYLRRLPVDVLKIDRSFVDGIAKTDEEWALAVAIVKMATSLGKRTVAEGVETAAQVAHLRALRCDLGQGYLFSKPLAADQFEQLLVGGGVSGPPRD